MKTLSTSLATILTAICISGCSYRDAAPPECSDPGVIETANKVVLSIYDKQIVGAGSKIPASNLFGVSVGPTMPVGYDAAIKARSCTGKVQVTLKQSLLDKLNVYAKGPHDPQGGSWMTYHNETLLLRNGFLNLAGHTLVEPATEEFDVTFTVQMQEKSQGNGYMVNLQTTPLRELETFVNAIYPEAKQSLEN